MHTMQGKNPILVKPHRSKFLESLLKTPTNPRCRGKALPRSNSTTSPYPAHESHNGNPTPTPRITPPPSDIPTIQTPHPSGLAQEKHVFHLRSPARPTFPNQKIFPCTIAGAAARKRASARLSITSLAPSLPLSLQSRVHPPVAGAR